MKTNLKVRNGLLARKSLLVLALVLGATAWLYAFQPGMTVPDGPEIVPDGPEVTRMTVPDGPEVVPDGPEATRMTVPDGPEIVPDGPEASDPEW